MTNFFQKLRNSIAHHNSQHGIDATAAKEPPGAPITAAHKDQSHAPVVSHGSMHHTHHHAHHHFQKKKISIVQLSEKLMKVNQAVAAAANAANLVAVEAAAAAISAGGQVDGIDAMNGPVPNAGEELDSIDDEDTISSVSDQAGEADAVHDDIIEESEEERLRNLSSAQRIVLLHNLCARGELELLHKNLHMLCKILHEENNEEGSTKTEEQPNQEDAAASPSDLEPPSDFHLDNDFLAMGRGKATAHCLQQQAGATLMHTAAQYDQVNIMNYLMKAKVKRRLGEGAEGEIATLRVEEPQGATPLTLAVLRGSASATLLILHHDAQYQVTHIDSKDNTALHYAVAKHHFEIAESLCLFGAKPDAKGFAGRTPVLAAVSVGDIEALDFLMNRGASLYRTTPNHENVLHMAARHPHVIAHILQNWVEDDRHYTQLLTERNHKDQTLLHLCAEHGLNKTLITVVYFLSHSLRVTKEHQNAAAQGGTETDVGVGTPSNVTPLPTSPVIAAKNIRRQSVFSFGKKRMDSGVLPSLAATPGATSSVSPSDKALQLLVNILNAKGHRQLELTPLHVAVMCNQLSTVRMLCMSVEVDVDAQNSSKDTALHIALRQNKLDVVQVLCVNGHANRHIKNLQKNSPAHMARQMNVDLDFWDMAKQGTGEVEEALSALNAAHEVVESPTSPDVLSEKDQSRSEVTSPHEPSAKAKSGLGNKILSLFGVHQDDGSKKKKKKEKSKNKKDKQHTETEEEIREKSEKRLKEFARHRRGSQSHIDVNAEKPKELEKAQANPGANLINWGAGLILGENSIDDEHHILIDLINMLYRHVTGADEDQGDGNPQRGGSSGWLLLYLLGSLFEYVDYHFSNEERKMKIYEYPQEYQEKHKAEHRAFTSKVKDLHERLLKSNKKEGGDSEVEQSLDMELLNYLSDWLSHHILHVDRWLAQWLNTHQPVHGTPLDDVDEDTSVMTSTQSVMTSTGTTPMDIASPPM